MPYLLDPELRDFAERLFADEALALTASEANVPLAFRVFEDLRRPLTTLAGAAGFRSLLLRALTLAKRDEPSLDAWKVTSDGSLESAGPGQNHYDVDRGALLLAHIIGLLFTFIGETLTLRLVHDVWPDTSFSTSTAEGTGNHESRG